MNVYAKFRCAPLRIKKALGIFGELITTTARTRTRRNQSSILGPTFRVQKFDQQIAVSIFDSQIIWSSAEHCWLIEGHITTLDKLSLLYFSWFTDMLVMHLTYVMM